MNIGLRAIILVAALVAFIIGIFSDSDQGDCIAAGLALYTAAVLVGELGMDRSFGTNRRNT